MKDIYLEIDKKITRDIMKKGMTWEEKCQQCYGKGCKYCDNLGYKKFKY